MRTTANSSWLSGSWNISTISIGRGGIDLMPALWPDTARCGTSWIPMTRAGKLQILMDQVAGSDLINDHRTDRHLVCNWAQDCGCHVCKCLNSNNFLIANILPQEHI